MAPSADRRRSWIRRTIPAKRSRDMMSDIAQGKAAWARLRQGSKSWDDWVLVGHALLEGRAIALRDAGAATTTGAHYSSALNDWLARNRFYLNPSQRSRLL